MAMAKDRNFRRLRREGPERREGAGSPSNRSERAAERRTAIIDAAMEEFIARGFAAARLDDVARRAGVAKGTIYLYFKDKEALFEELVRSAIVPLVGTPDGAAAGGRFGPRHALEGFAAHLRPARSSATRRGTSSG